MHVRRERLRAWHIQSSLKRDGKRRPLRSKRQCAVHFPFSRLRPNPRSPWRWCDPSARKWLPAQGLAPSGVKGARCTKPRANKKGAPKSSKDMRSASPELELKQWLWDVWCPAAFAGPTKWRSFPRPPPQRRVGAAPDKVGPKPKERRFPQLNRSPRSGPKLVAGATQQTTLDRLRIPTHFRCGFPQASFTLRNESYQAEASIPGFA